MTSGEKFALKGLLVVNGRRLRNLDDDKLVGLVKTGQMDLIYLHLFSLGNFSRLVDMMGAEVSVA